MTTTLKVDAELKAYLPPLDRETKALLEESLKNAGRARQPIEVWKGQDVIIDGHNRYEICTRLKLPFETIELEFKDRKAVKQYQLEVQVSRRNLNKEQASQYRGQYMKLLRGKRADAIAKGEKVDTSKTVAKQAAEDTNVSEATVKRDAQFTSGVETLAKTDPKEAKKVIAGKSMINKGTIEKIGTAKGETAKEAAVADASKQATRSHRKQVTNRVTHLNKPNGSAIPAEREPVSDEATSAVIEKVALFLTAKTLGGRRGLMKQLVERMSKLEGTEFSVPPEYDAPAKATKAVSASVSDN